MKKLIVAALGVAVVATSAHAITVFDPTVNLTIKLQTAQEIAKFVEMINNQAQQINTLTAQLDEFKHYESLFGDPKTILLPTVQPLVSDLTQTELGETLLALESTINTTDAMLYGGNGLFASIGTTFNTPNGQTITRPSEPYKPVAAVQQTTDNYLAVSTNAAARRVALKEEIAVTTQQIKAATTDAEVQKLQGVLTGLSAALNNTDYEINQATTAALVQDIANRNDAQRQTEAKKEQQHAEFTEAVQKYGQTFRVMNAPTAFPTP
jgi:cell division protein FtsL